MSIAHVDLRVDMFAYSCCDTLEYIILVEERIDLCAVDDLAVWTDHIVEVLFHVQVDLLLFLIFLYILSRAITKGHQKLLLICQVALQHDLEAIPHSGGVGRVLAPDLKDSIHRRLLVNNYYRLDLSLRQSFLGQILDQQLVILHLRVVPEHVVAESGDRLARALALRAFDSLFSELLLIWCEKHESTLFVVDFFSFSVLHRSLLFTLEAVELLDSPGSPLDEVVGEEETEAD